VLRIIDDEGLVEASATKGERLRALLGERLDDHPHVGEIRGRGLLIGVELVADRETREPVARSAHLTEAVLQAARERGVLFYSGTGNANGVDGDTILIGPPFIVEEDELGRIASVLGDAIDEAVGTALPRSTQLAVRESPPNG
jgi:adenosylmethionine-8-amino-7-oxononanoate aminotransferase